ncbi:VOC family protein [Algiphilus aromaticivorans]|uniref:VOC family protein n=1 Tax=Algiphilus aromaticivorans TaxID=382454 RepID=UPI0018DB6CB3|nr:VOC family protein [Algiphilus aromaticivorans]
MSKVVFLSPEVSAYALMAQGLARQRFGDKASIVGASTQLEAPDPQAVAALSERGIDADALTTQHSGEVDLADADLVVSLGPTTEAPTVPGATRQLHWKLPALPREADASMQRTAFAALCEQLQMRIAILEQLLDLPEGPVSSEFHGSIRVADLPASVRFYAWLLNVWPKEWTHRYAIFIRPDLGLNFVLLVSDGKTLHHDTLYHLGVGVDSRQAVIDAYHRASDFGARIEKPPRTTWKGTPLHELWLSDPDGTLIEIYARLTDSELAEKPADEQPTFLVPGTEPKE